MSVSFVWWAGFGLFDNVDNAKSAHERSLGWIKENPAMTGGATQWHESVR